MSIMSLAAGPKPSGAGAAHLDVENTIAPVGEDNGGYVELFARHRPQSDCRVYMPLPSASSATTLRSGQAIAAPTATGSPWPIEPPATGR